MKTQSDDIHEKMTRAEIARQIRALVADREQLTARRAELFTRSSGTASQDSLSVDEIAARAHAKKLLNGNAPPSLEPPAGLDFSNTDRALAVQQRGIDLAVKILSENELVATAAEAVRWQEANSTKWRNLVREIIVSAARLETLEQAAKKMIDECVDINAVNLPMVNLIGCGEEMRVGGSGYVGFARIRPTDLIEAGLEAGLIKRRDVENAKNI